MNNITKNSITKKGPKLRGLSKTIYDLMGVKPTTSYVIKKTGKSSTHVGVYINRLVKRGYLKRVNIGVYKKVLRPGALTQISKNHKKTEQRKADGLLEKDYLRLHKLQIELLISSDIHKYIKNLVFTKKTFSNIRSSGNNMGRYFDVGNITYMLTGKKLFAFFPTNWEIEGDTIADLATKMYDQIWEEVNVLETRYHITLIKDGKVCFNIRNMHIALVKNGVAKELKERGIKNLVIYDEIDGKPRFIIDMSKGLPELEAIHPEKGFNDADEAKFFMENLKDGKVREIIENFGDIEEIKKLIHLLTIDLKNLVELQKIGLVNTELLAKSHTKTQLLLETEVMLRSGAEGKVDKEKDPPDYVG